VCWQPDYALRLYGGRHVCAACAIPYALGVVTQVVRESFVKRLFRELFGEKP
jgi:hypothetical protein